MIDDVMNRLGTHYRAAQGTVQSLEEDDRAILGQVRLVGAGLILILVMVLVLTEVWNAIDPSTNNGSYNGTFGDIYSSVENVGVASLTLLVVGILVIAAMAIMRRFSGGFGGR